MIQLREIFNIFKIIVLKTIQFFIDKPSMLACFCSVMVHWLILDQNVHPVISEKYLMFKVEEVCSLQYFT